jgi:hypothetical protein
LVGSSGDGGKFNDEEVVWSFHMGMGNIPKTPLLSTYKRRLPSPHFNNTQEKSTRAREEQHDSWA